MEKDYKEKDYKKVILIVIGICMVLIFAVWEIIVWNESNITEYEVGDSPIDSTEFKYSIDSVEYTKDSIDIVGWIVKNDCTEIKTAELYVVLRDSNSGLYYRMPTMVEKREDLSQLLGTEKIEMSGFSCSVRKKGLINSKKDYEIYLLYKSNGDEELVKLNSTVKEWEKQDEKDN